jgi:hypothetical protein
METRTVSFGSGPERPAAVYWPSMQSFSKLGIGLRLNFCAPATPMCRRVSRAKLPEMMDRYGSIRLQSRLSLKNRLHN